MSGIAGILDLASRRPVPEGVLERMSQAMAHRGTETVPAVREPGFGVVRRGSSLVPTLCVGTEGSAAPRPETTQSVESSVSPRGAWEQGDPLPEGEGTERFLRLPPSAFPLAFWDAQRRRLILARDRFGIRPLHWTRQGDWLLFASEIKTLLASGMVRPAVDRRGIAQVFTFFGLPGPVTCFEGIASIVPGHYLVLDAADGPRGASIEDHTYWQIDFPDRGHEVDSEKPEELVDRYEEVLLRAVERRLAGEGPVAAYSSGGLDSSLLIAMARRVLGEPIPTLTFAIEHPTRQESAGAAVLARHVGREPTLVRCTAEDLVAAYPGLVRAAESPVVDTSAAALYLLAEAAGRCGYRAVVTGEGADEWQAGYPWFQINRRVEWFNRPGLPLGQWGFWLYASWLGGRPYPWSHIRRARVAVGNPSAWLLVYHLMSTSKRRLFSPETLAATADYVPLEDLGAPPERLCRWHPLNQSLYVGARVHLPGLHLAARGDRAAMHASIEPRYPFLDDDVFDFLASLAPRWKFRGMQDKYLQRLLADRWLPTELTRGRKRLLHAPLEAFHRAALPPQIEELLSESELRRTGYFDPAAVQYWRRHVGSMRHGHRRLFIEMALVGVISTQLWHREFIDGNP